MKKLFSKLIRIETPTEKLLRTEKNVQIRVLRYADMHSGFTVAGIGRELDLNQEQMTFLQGEVSRGDGFFVHVGNVPNEGYKYMLTLEGKSRLLDHEEMVLARKNSREARWLAIAAIIISIVVGVIQILLTQDVRVTNESIKVEIATPLP